MVAILDGLDVWATWLGESGSAAAMAVLTTVEGVKRKAERGG